ncbi:6-phospho-3-hexuloisomerase [Sediminibacillus albus]|uniref:6-phospho-3-hexuloisomerase n=1 Tax=Sediminibacillus albus TaxID=407036 RepID=A0A1G8YKR1_9BACI|nr:6-phospho-3-hexuloisomerase [Sediminibacillus albus]SDK03459.1 6-phospho-3-hexuloisomerase [Sediminibacillus albus]
MTDITRIIQTVSQEISGVLTNIDSQRVEQFATHLNSAKRIFIDGEGRSGLMGKAFAMRLMHAGFEVYVVGETITPSISKGDLYVALSGSGSTGGTYTKAEKARAAEARIAAVTANPESPLSRLADVSVYLPTATKKRLAHEPATIQPLGNQFDQSLHLVLDAAVIFTIEKFKHTSHESLKQQHANLE